MRSHLTRQVFRRLIANEPIVHRGCLRRQAHTSNSLVVPCSRRPAVGDGRAPTHRPHRRSFLNIFSPKKKINTQQADMAPGMEALMHLDKMQRMRARLPTVQSVHEAVREFFRYKSGLKQAMTDTQAQLALKGLRFCLETFGEEADDEQASKWRLSHHDLCAGASALLVNRAAATNAHLELAKLIYEELSNPKQDPLPEIGRQFSSMKTFILLLCQQGRIAEAREILLSELSKYAPGRKEEMEFSGSSASQTPVDGPTARPWKDPVLYRRLFHDVLHSEAMLRNEVEFWHSVNIMREQGILSDDRFAVIMLDFQLLRGSAEGIQEWFPKSRKSLLNRNQLERGDFAEKHGSQIRRLLDWCLANSHTEYGHQIVREVLEKSPAKPVWDAILVWAAGCGKGADEIDRMISVMEQTEVAGQHGGTVAADIVTINALVEFAISKNDPYLAERFIVLGKDRSIEPDARTFVFQMEYRLKVGDIDGALTAYKNLQTMESSPDDEVDIPVINKLIVTLCESTRHDFETIMAVAADLSDRRARFDAATVARLSIVHLRRDEIHDVIDLLNTHAYHFSSTDRSSIVDSLISYTVDPTTEIARAWDAYIILRSIFDEIARPERTKIMNSFYARKRPDMAVNIFIAMRSHSRDDTIPTVETYHDALLGAAENTSLETVDIIHNQLKLDFNVDPNTYLYNTLMIAYLGCNEGRTALNFWLDIAASKEGPSFNSIHIAMRVCEMTPYGDQYARGIWDKLLNMNVELDSSLWASYAGALAGNDDVRFAIERLEEAVKKDQVEIDALIIAHAYSGAKSPEAKNTLEAWAKDRFPDVWIEVEALDIQEGEDGLRRIVNLDRTIGP